MSDSSAILSSVLLGIIIGGFIVLLIIISCITKLQTEGNQCIYISENEIVCGEIRTCINHNGEIICGEWKEYQNE